MERDDGAADMPGELRHNITFARMVERLRRVPPSRAFVSLQEPIDMSLIEDLAAAVAASDLSRYEIAKRAGVDQAILSRLVSGERGVTLPVAERIAEAVGMTLELRRKKTRRGQK